ncbi:MAG: hypothetical protein ABSC50_07940 [Candidatus Bathyarchaeia archaeon]
MNKKATTLDEDSGTEGDQIGLPGSQYTPSTQQEPPGPGALPSRTIRFIARQFKLICENEGPA